MVVQRTPVRGKFLRENSPHLLGERRPNGVQLPREKGIHVSIISKKKRFPNWLFAHKKNSEGRSSCSLRKKEAQADVKLFLQGRPVLGRKVGFLTKTSEAHGENTERDIQSLFKKKREIECKLKKKNRREKSFSVPPRNLKSLEKG